MKNIKHVTINTGHTIKYEDDTSLMEERCEYIKNMVDSAKKGDLIKLPDNTFLDCAIEAKYKIYSATLFGDGANPIPIIETAGAVDEKGAKIVWDTLKILFKKVWQMETPLACPEPPFICDIVFPSAIYRQDIFPWSGSFARSFGFEMLENLSERKYV